ncbi:MAG: LysR family transcriptional regulator [Neisseriaceae bacterium]|nr:LysR family transcriptional regulator [Neisseriaceae bacterium]
MQSQIKQIQTFLQVVESGSFTKAAEYLNMSRAMASIDVKNLEQKLGVSLLVRSTRHLALTEAGQSFYHDFKAIQAQMAQALERVQQDHHAISGTLRITSTNEFGRQYVLPLIGAFCRQYPQLHVHYAFDSALNDLISDQLDLVIRLGTLKNSAVKSRTLGRYDIVLVATPEFLIQHPIPHPQALQHCPWISHSSLHAHSSWRLSHDTQADIVLTPPSGRYVANAASAIRAMTLASLGVSICPYWLVADDLAQGRLIHLCPEYRLPQQSIQLLFPNQAHLPQKTRAFIDFLLSHLNPQDWTLPT